MTYFAWILGFVAVTSFVGCGARPIGVPYRNRTQFESEWSGYGRLAAHKALAVAGDRGGRHATGYAFGKASGEEAVREALDACAQRRADRRIEEECRLYAVDDEVQSGW